MNQEEYKKGVGCREMMPIILFAVIKPVKFKISNKQLAIGYLRLGFRGEFRTGHINLRTISYKCGLLFNPDFYLG